MEKKLQQIGIESNNCNKTSNMLESNLTTATKPASYFLKKTVGLLVCAQLPTGLNK
jgi:hypothetical protein